MNRKRETTQVEPLWNTYYLLLLFTSTFGHWRPSNDFIRDGWMGWEALLLDRRCSISLHYIPSVCRYKYTNGTFCIRCACVSCVVCWSLCAVVCLIWSAKCLTVKEELAALRHGPVSEYLFREHHPWGFIFAVYPHNTNVPYNTHTPQNGRTDRRMDRQTNGLTDDVTDTDKFL